MRPLLERLGGFLPAAIALTLPTVFLPAAVDSFILPRTSIVLAGACLGIGLALLAPGGPGLGQLRWPLAAAAAAAVLAFAFSVSWPLSLAGAYTRYESLPVRLAYLGLFASAVWLLRTNRSRELVIAAFVFGTTVACLEALVQWAQDLSFRPDGNLGNANLLGALIAMAIPLAASNGVRRGRFLFAWWLAVWVMEAGLFVTTSRSGSLGALAGCVALLALSARRRLWVTVSLAAGGLVSAAAMWAIVLGPLRLLNDDPARSRLLLWPDALRMIAARPLTGWGEDATGLALGRFISGNWAPGVTYDRTHSGLLEIGATQGLVGLVALGWLLFTFSRGLWRQRFTPAVAPLGAACVGYTVWVLFNFDWAPATGAFWLLAGTAWSAARASETDPAPQVATISAPNAAVAPLRSGLAVILALAAVWLGLMPVLADAWYFRGRADLAVVVDPLQSRYRWVLGQGLVAAGSVSQGVEQMRQAADLGETEPSLYVELGDREKQLGRSAQARADYRRALEIDPYFAPAIQRLARS